jgi:hypothetical protein
MHSGRGAALAVGYLWLTCGGAARLTKGVL